MNIKVMRVITRLNIGGPSIQAVLLSRELDRRYFDSILVSGSIDTGEGDMSYLLNGNGISYANIPQLGRSLDIKDDIIALWRLYLLIKKEKPDILHTHTAKAGTLGRLAAILAGVRVKIHTFHGHTFYGYFTPLKTRLFIAIERFLAHFTSKIVVISDKQYNDIRRVLGVSENKIKLIPLGFDLNKFLSAAAGAGDYLKNELNISRDTLLVGIVGRLIDIKNHSFFIDIAYEFKRRNKDKVRFVIIGDGILRDVLQKKVSRMGLSEYVRFLGWRRDLENIYGGLDVVALTSLNEGTPVSLIEAMASARPVVATDVGGVGDIVLDGKTGFLCRLNDLNCFYEKLASLLDDRRLRLDFGMRARQIAQERFSKDRLVNDIEKMYLKEMETAR